MSQSNSFFAALSVIRYNQSQQDAVDLVVVEQAKCLLGGPATMPSLGSEDPNESRWDYYERGKFGPPFYKRGKLGQWLYGRSPAEQRHYEAEMRTKKVRLFDKLFRGRTPVQQAMMNSDERTAALHELMKCPEHNAKLKQEQAEEQRVREALARRTDEEWQAVIAKRYSLLQSVANEWLQGIRKKLVDQAEKSRGVDDAMKGKCGVFDTIFDEIQQTLDESNTASSELEIDAFDDPRFFNLDGVLEYERKLWEFVRDAIAASDGRHAADQKIVLEDDSKGLRESAKVRGLRPRQADYWRITRANNEVTEQMVKELCERLLAADSLTDFRELEESLFPDPMAYMARVCENNELLGEQRELKKVISTRWYSEAPEDREISPFDQVPLDKDWILFRVPERRIDIIMRRLAECESSS